MAYSDEAVKTKLSALNETQDSIVTVAQWIMFHRRHADRTAALWLARLQESPTAVKRLTLIYLANEVVQQSRARSKTEFLHAFEPVIGDATSLAYKSASTDIRDKLRRVVEVWRQRSVFDRSIQESTEQRLREIDQQRAGKATGARLGGSLFGGGVGSIPAGLEDVAKSQTAVNKSDASGTPALEKAQAETVDDLESNAPTPHVHAHKLRELAKTLAAARGAVEESIKLRRELLSDLEKLVEGHRSKLAADEDALSGLIEQQDVVETKKNTVEDAILTQSSYGDSKAGSGKDAVQAPEAETFTPPAPEVEGFTPPPQDLTHGGDDAPILGENTGLEQNYASTTGAEGIHEYPPDLNEPPPAFEPPTALSAQESAANAANDFLDSFGISSFNGHGNDLASANAKSSDPRLKRRKISHATQNDVDEDIFGAAAVGLDEEGVSALLGGGNESGKEADVSGYGW